MNRSSSVEIQRQVEATRVRPLRTLPASWWVSGVAEAMCDWMRRFTPGAQS